MCEVTQAAEQPKGSIERLLLVAAFSVSPYATCLRAQRSFNPVLGGESAVMSIMTSKPGMNLLLHTGVLTAAVAQKPSSWCTLRRGSAWSRSMCALLALCSLALAQFL